MTTSQITLILIGVSLVGVILVNAATSQSFKSPCGNEKQVAGRIGQCLSPVFEVALGKMTVPKNDADLLAIAERFANSEKCIRSVSRECLTGLHKTTTGSVAASSRRFRQQEWKTPQLRANYIESCRCASKLTKELLGLFQNQTAIVQAVRDSTLKPEQKLTKACCIFGELDNELSRLFNDHCPNSTPQVLKMMHGLTEDARSTVCIGSKCNNVLKPYINSKYKPPQEFIEPVMEILFGLSSGPDD